MTTEQMIQWAMLLATALAFAAAFVLGFGHMRRAGIRGSAEALPQDGSMGPTARGAVIVAMVLGVGLAAWRAAAERSLALAVSNPFDAFLLLGLLLAGVVIYFRWTRHLRSLSFFLLPMIVILLGIGAVLSLIHPATDGQAYANTWTFIHVITIFAGTICFALSFVGGIVYLLADRQLRRKGLDASHRWIGLPPLASVETFNRWMVYVGFPLLTVATVSGILRLAQTAHAESLAGTAGHNPQAVKIALGSLAWVVYAVLLHVPLNPRFRGPRAAWLSIVGFAFFIGAFVVARWN